MTVGLIDGHAHLLPLGLPDLAGTTGDPRWPSLVVDGGGDTGRIMRGPEVFRPVRRSCWDPARRTEDLDRHGVDVQIVSPVPVTLADWAEADRATAFLAAQNDRIAEEVAGSGGRLVGLGAVALQDPDGAMAELHRATGELGLAGVEVGTRNGGAELDDLRFRPFLAEAAATGIPLFLHPVDGGGATRCADPLSAFGVGMLTDTALAARALVFGGVLADLPGLRVCLSHGGGTFPLAYPRLRMWATSVGPDRDQLDAAGLDALVRRIHVDTLVFDPAVVGWLIERYGPDRVLFGSDDPFIPWSEVARPLAAPEAATEALRRSTASAFYRLDATAGH